MAFPSSRWVVGGLWRGVLREEGSFREIYAWDLRIVLPVLFQYGKSTHFAAWKNGGCLVALGQGRSVGSLLRCVFSK